MKELIGLLIRHALTAFGASEFLKDDSVNQLAGAVMLIGGVVWSIVQKKKAKTAAALAVEKAALPLIVIYALALVGCAHVSTIEETYNPETKGNDRTKFSGFFFFNRGGVEGLTVGKRSDKTSTTLSVAKGSTETQSEAIKAAGEALGAGIAAGVKKAVVP